MPNEPIYLNADPVRLGQVFSNLLNNAYKYTEPNGRIYLSAERQGSDAVVTVKDTGVGIPQEMLPKIFDMFTQVDRSLDRAQGGLGIGLTLVQRIVGLHDGTVIAQSEGVGQGSEFQVRLPIVVYASDLSADESAVDIAPTINRRILVVDDNQDSALSLALLLKISGNETRTAFDGLAALDAAEDFKPEIIWV